MMLSTKKFKVSRLKKKKCGVIFVWVPSQNGRWQPSWFSDYKAWFVRLNMNCRSVCLTRYEAKQGGCGFRPADRQDPLCGELMGSPQVLQLPPTSQIHAGWLMALNCPEVWALVNLCQLDEFSPVVSWRNTIMGLHNYKIQRKVTVFWFSYRARGCNQINDTLFKRGITNRITIWEYRMIYCCNHDDTSHTSGVTLKKSMYWHLLLR